MACLWFFFFSSRRRHTRSLRDWSSDVCSSDLLAELGCQVEAADRNAEALAGLAGVARITTRWIDLEGSSWRSEERRVGKECRSGWVAEREKKTEDVTADQERRE